MCFYRILDNQLLVLGWISTKIEKFGTILRYLGRGGGDNLGENILVIHPFDAEFNGLSVT